MESIRRHQGLASEIAAEAEDVADRLKQAIFDPAQPRIKELAGNPLLVTILALVFRNRGSLPQHRADLYQRALEILIEDWRDTGMTTDRLTLVLAPLAAYIHGKYSTGLIPANDLREQLRRSMVTADSDLARRPAELSDQLDRILHTAHDTVGLLAARGEGIYGFLHLTFQEYLAGLSLVRDRSRAAEAILGKLGDPRWQEPILLALGRIGSKEPCNTWMDAWGTGDRLELLLRLLDAEDPLADLIPRSALLLARALEEMAEVPDKAVEELARRLLRSYADRERIGQFPLVRERVERTFERLHAGPHAAVVERVVVEELGRPETAAAAAALLRGLEWYTDRLAAALQAGLGHDRGEWDWPIQRCLLAIVTPPVPLAEPKPPQPPSPDQMEKLRQSKLFEYQELRANLSVAEAAYAEKLDRYQLHQGRPPAELSLDRLPFRAALEREAVLAERVAADPAWQRLVVALYGGYEDMQAVETFRDYREIAQFLRQPEAIRNAEIARDRAYFVGRFGHDDVVYNAAVYLDVGMGGRMRRAKQSPKFLARAIFRDSALTPRLLAALRREQAPSSVVPYLRNQWATVGRTDRRVEAAVALIALGEDFSDDLEGCSDASLIKAVVERLHQIRHSLADSIMRSMSRTVTIPPAEGQEGQKAKSTTESALFPALRHLSRILTSPAWSSVFSSLVALRVEYGDEPFDPRYLLDLPPPCNLQPLTEFWAQRLATGTVDDIDFNFTFSLDRMRATPPHELIASLRRLNESVNLRWPGRLIPWEVEPLPPVSGSWPDIPTEVIDSVENLRTEAFGPAYRQSVRSGFLDAIRKRRGEVPPGLIPELLTVNKFNPCSGSEFLVAFAPNDSDPSWQGLVTQARRITNAYYRGRALCRLGRYLPQQRSTLMAEARKAANEILDPHAKCRLLESLLLHFGGANARQIFEETADAARAVTDPDDKARALARLSRQASGDDQHALLRDALTSAQAIPDEAAKAETLWLLQPLLRRVPDLYAQARQTARALGDPQNQARALGLRGRLLLYVEADVLPLSPDMPALWTPLVLGALILDITRQFGDSAETDALWRQLPSDPSPTARQLLLIGRENGLALTRTAAEALERCVENADEEAVRDLLPLLQDLTPDASSLVEGWLDHWHEGLAHHAALCLAEPGRRLTEQTLPGLLALITGNEDRTRVRASLVLQGGVTLFKRESRNFLSSELGPTVIEGLGRVGVEFERSGNQGPARVIELAFSDILFDSPDQIRKWCADINLANANADTSEFVLSWILDVDEKCWEVLREQYQNGGERTRAAILRSLLYMFVNTNEPIHFEAGTENWLRDGVGPWAEVFRVIPGQPYPIVKAIQLAQTRNPGAKPVPLVAAAEAELAGLAVKITPLLSADCPVFEELGTIGEHLSWCDSGLLASPYNSDNDLWAMIDEKNDDLFVVMVHWLAKRLPHDESLDELYLPQYWLLFTASVYAERSPDTFARLAMELNLEPMLTRAARAHPKIVARVAAVRLLGKLRRVSTETVVALLDSLLDEQQVREMASRVLRDLPRVKHTSITPLLQALDHDSGLVASCAAQVLTQLARSERLPTEVRSQILAALADAVRSPRSERGVYEIAGAGSSDSDGHRRLSYTGTVRAALCRALLDAVGGL
jgi:hypothetical protein